MRSEDGLLIVLNGTLMEKRGGRFYYLIEGEAKWLDRFKDQKRGFVEDHAGNLIYSVPLAWYVGKKCPICVGDYNDFGGKLFFNLNEHEHKASVLARVGMDYWKKLAADSKDENWLERSSIETH